MVFCWVSFKEFEELGDRKLIIYSFFLGGLVVVLLFGKIFGLFNIKWFFNGFVIFFNVGFVICGVVLNMNVFIVGCVLVGIGGNGMYFGV